MREMTMENITGLTLGGAVWTPEFVTALDPKKCIGCGRCFKVCSRDVLDLIIRGEEMEMDDDEDYDEDDTASVMMLKNPGDCIGCGACSRVCPKGCYTFSAQPVQGV
jgi:Nif-specific ferredoxin III